MKYLKLFALFSMMLLFYQCEETLTSASKITYEVGAVSFTDAVDQNGNGYASTMKFSFDIDVSSGTEEVYVKIGYKVHEASNSNVYDTYFVSQPFTITGDASDDAKYIIIGDPEIEELSHNSYDFNIEVYKGDDENGTNILAQADKNSFSDLNDILMETSAEDSPVRVQFNNMVFTDISVTINNNDTKVIAPADSVIFTFPGGNPGNITIYAETWGKRSDGLQLGEKVTWNATYDMTGTDFMKFNLNLNEELYFIYMKNTGTAFAGDWSPIYVNEGTSSEKVEDIAIQADSKYYSVGYYDYVSGSSAVRAQFSGSSDSYSWTLYSTGEVNQGWILSDESAKKPVSAVNEINSLIYEVGGNVPVQQQIISKPVQEGINIISK